jgi:cell wall-associated NlpC family hydrolase
MVQVSLTAAGIGAPRDSDMQQGALGADVPLSGIDRLRRGDLIFWKGHVAIARDAQSIVHANAFHMATAIEPTREALSRIKAAGSEVVAIKRL